MKSYKIFVADKPLYITDKERDFFTSHKFIEAAGGLVRDIHNRYLIIRRFGKWDLPKGKMESGETPAMAALREVEEECGIKRLTIIRPLNPTLHTYVSKKGKNVLKQTHWFVMQIMDLQTPVPQQEEDITDACWFSGDEIKKLVEYDTYNAIKDVLTEAGLIG